MYAMGERHEDERQAWQVSRRGFLIGSLATALTVTVARAVDVTRPSVTVYENDATPLKSGAVVNVMNPGHVESVFIAGKVRKWRGSLVGVDIARVLQLAERARDAVVQRAGFKLDLLG